MMSQVESWTHARYWSFIRSALRKAWAKYPNKHICKKNARIARNQYVCASCEGVFASKEVSVDHIDPCGKLNGYDDAGDFIKKLFCSLDGLQLLCYDCHRLKTFADRGLSPADIKVIDFGKQNAKQQKDQLISLGITPERNKELRLKQYREYIDVN